MGSTEEKLPKSRWAKIVDGEFEGAHTGAIAAAFEAPPLGEAPAGEQLTPELR